MRFLVHFEWLHMRELTIHRFTLSFRTKWTYQVPISQIDLVNKGNAIWKRKSVWLGSGKHFHTNKDVVWNPQIGASFSEPGDCICMIGFVYLLLPCASHSTASRAEPGLEISSISVASTSYPNLAVTLQLGLLISWKEQFLTSKTSIPMKWSSLIQRLIFLGCAFMSQPQLASNPLLNFANDISSCGDRSNHEYDQFISNLIRLLKKYLFAEALEGPWRIYTGTIEFLGV